MHTSWGTKYTDPGMVSAINKAMGHSQVVVERHYEEIDKGRNAQLLSQLIGHELDVSKFTYYLFKNSIKSLK